MPVSLLPNLNPTLRSKASKVLPEIPASCSAMSEMSFGGFLGCCQTFKQTFNKALSCSSCISSGTIVHGSYLMSLKHPQTSTQGSCTRIACVDPTVLLSNISFLFTKHILRLTSDLLKAPDELKAAGTVPERRLYETSKIRTCGNTLLLLGRDPLHQIASVNVSSSVSCSQGQL